MANWKILVNQWENEHSCRDELSHHLVFTKSETAGEVLHPWVRSLGVAQSSSRDGEVPQASPDAD